MAEAVRVDGLRELRSAVRQIDPAMAKEIQQVTKLAATVVAEQASRNAPRRTGRLAASIKGGTSGDRGVVRSRLPYASVHEFGGRIAPRGTPFRIKESAYVRRALDSKADDIERELLDGFDRVVRRYGWK